jgi:hypothetical protein
MASQSAVVVVGESAPPRTSKSPVSVDVEADEEDSEMDMTSSVMVASNGLITSPS